MCLEAEGHAAPPAFCFGQEGRWVATRVDDRQAAGYLCFGRTPMTAATYDLYWLVSHAQARGRGVASSLVRAMEDELRSVGAQSVRVETSLKESYGAARSLYQKLGYPMLAQFPDFYRPGDDLLVYYKRL